MNSVTGDRHAPFVREVKTPIGVFGTQNFGTDYRVKVYAEVDRGHSPETWADIVIDRMFLILDTAPDFIKDQAQGEKDRMKQMFRETLTAAIISDRHTLCVQLEKKGFPDVAAAIKGLRGTLIL